MLCVKPNEAKTGKCVSIPDVQYQRRLTNFSFEGADAAGDEFDFDLGMIVEPVVDGVVEILHSLIGKFAVKGFDSAGAGAVRKRFTFEVARLGGAGDAEGFDGFFGGCVIELIDEADGVEIIFVP